MAGGGHRQKLYSPTDRSDVSVCVCVIDRLPWQPGWHGDKVRATPLSPVSPLWSSLSLSVSVDVSLPPIFSVCRQITLSCGLGGSVGLEVFLSTLKCHRSLIVYEYSRALSTHLLFID